MKYRLGGLTINELTCILGIELTHDDEEWFRETMIKQIPEIKSGHYTIDENEWHAFDLPRIQIHAGSKKFADHIIMKLKKYMNNGVFPKQDNVKVTYSETREEQFGYREISLIKDMNAEIFYCYSRIGNFKEVRFFLKDRITNKRNIALQEIEVVINESIFEESLAVPDINKSKKRIEYKKNRKGKLIRNKRGQLIPIGIIPKEKLYVNSIEEGKCIIEEGGKQLVLTRWPQKPIPAEIKDDNQ